MDLKKYQWKLRILRVNTPDYKNKKYIETKEIYKKNIKQFHKKYVKLITNITNKFNIELIGFDGKVKYVYTYLDPELIISDIEKMPLDKKLQNNKKPINLSLFSDYNPETTIKGLGYKDKEKALYTINKIKNQPIKYQISVINTMIGRAKSHPYQTNKMKEAIKVFEKWLKNYKKNKYGGKIDNNEDKKNIYYEEYIRLKQKYLNLKSSKI